MQRPLLNLNRFRSVVEIVANLALITAVAVGLKVWISRPAASARPEARTVAASSQSAVVGSKIGLQGLNWGAHNATLVVAISSSCHFCVSSTPFYNRITHEEHRNPVVVVMPQEEKEAQEFLVKHAITPSAVVSADLAEIQVEATPTLLLVSSSGVVTKAWVGELTEAQQKQVREFLDQA